MTQTREQLNEAVAREFGYVKADTIIPGAHELLWYDSNNQPTKHRKDWDFTKTFTLPNVLRDKFPEMVEELNGTGYWKLHHWCGVHCWRDEHIGQDPYGPWPRFEDPNLFIATARAFLAMRAVEIVNALNGHERLVAVAIKVADWFSRNADRADDTADRSNGRLPAFEESCRADARNYRAMERHIRDALAAQGETI